MWTCRKTKRINWGLEILINQRRMEYNIFKNFVKEVIVVGRSVVQCLDRRFKIKTNSLSWVLTVIIIFLFQGLVFVNIQTSNDPTLTRNLYKGDGWSKMSPPLTLLV